MINITLKQWLGPSQFSSFRGVGQAERIVKPMAGVCAKSSGKAGKAPAMVGNGHMHGTRDHLNPFDLNQMQSSASRQHCRWPLACLLKSSQSSVWVSHPVLPFFIMDTGTMSAFKFVCDDVLDFNKKRPGHYSIPQLKRRRAALKASVLG